MTKIDLTAIEEVQRHLIAENAKLREVNAAQADRIEALEEQLRQAQQRRTFARSGE